MLLRVEEVNEQGGVHGRKIRLLVEDDGYDPKKAVLAAQKLVNQDEHLRDGGPPGHRAEHRGHAGAVRQERRSTSSRSPRRARCTSRFHRLKYSFAVTYFDQMRIAAAAPGQGQQRQEGLRDLPGRRLRPRGAAGAEAGLKHIGMVFTEKTSYKRGATDFSSQVAQA